jgi:protein CpxP
MKRFIRNTIIVASLALCTGIAQAEAAPCGTGDGPPHLGKHFKKISRELGLSADQKAQVQEIFKKGHEEARPILDKLAVEHRAERALIQADTVDEAAIRAQAAKLSALHADMAVHRAHMTQELRKVLTPEQFAKFKVMQDKRDQAMDKRRSRGPAGKPGRDRD